MKYLLIFCLTILSGIFAKAQSSIQYDTCSLIQQHAGEWKYINGNDTIKVFLKYHRSMFANDPKFVFDDLWGNVEYKHGNNIIFSDYGNRFFNLPYIIDTLSMNYRTVVLHPKICNIHSELRGDFYYRKNGLQVYNVRLTVDPSGNTMLWHQEFERTMRSDLSVPSNPPAGLNKMPDDFILIKQ